MKKEIVSGVKALLAGMLVVSMLAGCGQEAAQGDASNQMCIRDRPCIAPL